MAKTTKTIPDGFHTITPQLVVAGAQKFIAFAQEAFGAEHLHSMPGADGKTIMHAALRLGDSTLFLSDKSEFAKPTQANLFLYVADVDAAVARATKAGCKLVVPVADMFWGDRWGMVEDAFGNQWQLATHVEDVTPEEMQRRMVAQGAKG
jgi:PhnB protein